MSDVTGVFCIIIVCVGSAVLNITSYLNSWEPPIYLAAFLVLAISTWWKIVSDVIKIGSVRGGLQTAVMLIGTLSCWMAPLVHLGVVQGGQAAWSAMSFW